ncbi:MAG: type II toxin-antitoxin system PemK/MazF family toxin [bacterium]
MKRGEIWLVNLDPTKGAEIKDERPAVIVNRDSLGILPLKVIVPITRWQDRYKTAPWMVKIVHGAINGLDEDSSIDTFQVRSVSKGRLKHKIGEISETVMKQIEQGLKVVLKLT